MRSQKKKMVLALLTAVLLIATAGAVYAYLSANAGTGVSNSMEPAGATDPTISSYVVDVGTPGYAVYVRAFVVVTWQDSEGNIYGQMPVEGTDYSIVWSTGEGENWFQNSDGFYYFRNPVAYDGTNASSRYTDPLIKSITEQVTCPGYTLNVEIISQTIQAVGYTNGSLSIPSIPAVQDAWGVVVNSDNTLGPTEQAD